MKRKGEGAMRGGDGRGRGLRGERGRDASEVWRDQTFFLS